MNIVLELDASNSNVLDELPRNAYHVVSDRGFSGGLESVQFLITVTTVMVPVLSRIIVEQIRSRKHVRLVVNGVEVSGVSEKTVLVRAVLNELAENSNDPS